MSSSVNPSAVGESVTFSAAVKTVSGIPTGTVTFYDGTSVLGSATVVNGGGSKTLNSAAISTSTLAAGSHNIQAVYSGDNVFAGSTSAIVVQVVQTAANATTTVLNASATSAMAGQAIMFTARVTSASSGTATGTVTFSDGTSVLAQVTLDGTGQATLTTSSLSPGTHTIAAAYGGDANFLASASAPLTVSIAPAPLVATTTTLASSADPSAAGTLITLTATVTSASGIPTGTVTFQDGSATLATVTLQNGLATLSSVVLTTGTHSLSAGYSGDANNAAGSGTLTQVVNPPAKVATTTNLTSSSNPSTYGQTITFTATVSGTGGVPSGVVTFSVGTSIGAVTLDPSGTAVYTTSSLPAGTTTVSAAYSGDTTFGGSTSPLVPQQVNPAPLTITASSGSMTYGGAVPAITPSYSGFVSGDTAVSLTTGPTCLTTATNTSPVATYPSTCSGAVASNYTISYVAGTVTVNPAKLTITASSGSMTQGGTPPTITASYSGFVAGNTAASLATGPTCSTTATSTSPAATYPSTCSGAVASNYTISYVAGTVKVNPVVNTAGGADLAISVGTGESEDGQVTFIVRVRNAGPGTASKVTMTDALPAALKFVSARPGSAGASTGVCSGPVVGQTGTLSCTLNSLAPGMTWALQVFARTTVRQSIKVVNTVGVTSVTQDPNTTNNTASIAVQVRANN